MDSPPTRRPGRWLTIVVVTVAIVCVGLPAAAWWVLSESTGPRDGDDVARDEIRHAAARLNDFLGYPTRARNAETFAARIVEREEEPRPATDGDSMRIEPFAWSGRVTGSKLATIDVRFTATVAQRDPASFGSRGTTAGSATACYRFVLQLYRDTARDEIDCPNFVDPPIPVSEVIPALPDDAKQRLEAVLLSTTPDSLSSAVRAAFPDEFITVDTATHGGELVAAVGVPAERDCLLAVRQVDGTIDYPGYDRVWLEPGEVGCRVALYTAPPR